MTLEIPDTEQFSKKLAYFLVAMQKLERAGIDTDPDYLESMVDDFLTQFTATTPMPATPKAAGYVVVANITGWLTGHFRERLFETEEEALFAIDHWVQDTGQGKAYAYGVREVTYFG